ncbi:MAG: L,D-transpeptidase family protein [Novosphingobium sp.]|nr:L,D-transpeptidase family protein [Novosphingobium sp.]MBP6554119.1 L,D-transpeptidase family protein [Novosphingobium sp.]
MRIRRSLLALAVLLTGATDDVVSAPLWNPDAIGKLRAWVAAAPDDALPRPDSNALDSALAIGDPSLIDVAASALALKLARMHLLGSASAAERAGWRIVDSDRDFDVEAQLSVALAGGRIDDFLAGQRPQHPEYAALREALRSETDPVRRQKIARSMERWRWMPISLGQDYLLVNAAGFELTRWRGGQRVGSWRVIVGKTASPTPIFSATVTGVNINPWWNVPSNIVRESVGGLIRRSPATARARGYVWGGGSVRQKPGPGNALGQMKLVMPNPFSVYLHDTPNRDLFNQDVRALSHGCVRVGDALGLAESLLAGVKNRSQIDALVASRKSVTVGLIRPVPVYIAYFTAGIRSDGSLALYDDIYNRDRRVPLALAEQGSECAG